MCGDSTGIDTGRFIQFGSRRNSGHPVGLFRGAGSLRSLSTSGTIAPSDQADQPPSPDCSGACASRAWSPAGISR